MGAIEPKHVILVCRLLLFAGGMIIGVDHFLVAVNAVASGAMVLSFWAFALAGPFSTLPASLTAFVNPKIGAIWLAAGAMISFTVVLLARPAEQYSEMFMRYTMPMIGLAALAFILSRHTGGRSGAAGDSR